jgi:hypothetical protein
MFNVIFYNISDTESSPQIDSSRTNLKSLTDGSNMFKYGSNLTTNLNRFSSELPILTNGTYMFFECTNLTSFYSNLSRLTDG